MATIIHTELKRGMTGSPTHSFVTWDTDDVDYSFLDETDSGVITAANVDYDEVDAATVVGTGEFATLTDTDGVVSISGTVTHTALTGDAADYFTVFKNSGTPATSPLCITWDSASTGLPITPNGNDVDITLSGNTVLTLAG